MSSSVPRSIHRWFTRLGTPGRGPALWALGLGAGLGLAMGLSCSGDDITESRPEPPPVVDGGGDGAADDTTGETCPEGPPKVGENCRSASVEDTCTYEAGTCTVNGQEYMKRESYRCYQGNWIKWPQPEKSPCDE